MTEAPGRDDRDDEDLLTMEEVADIARMSIPTLRYRLKTKTGPEGFRLGKKRVFRRRQGPRVAPGHRGSAKPAGCRMSRSCPVPETRGVVNTGQKRSEGER